MPKSAEIDDQSRTGHRPSAIRTAVLLLVALLPQGLKRLIYRYGLRWDVHQDAVIGVALVDVGHLSMGPGSAIGHFTVLKGCELAVLDAEATIGSFNWISGPPLSTGLYPSSPGRRPELHLGHRAAIVSRHLIDCSDKVTLGVGALLAGSRSHILTHEIDRRRSVQTTAPVELEVGALVGTGVILHAGAVVPERSVLAPGAVLGRPLDRPGWMYGGVPARPIKELSEDEAYFRVMPPTVT